MSDVVVAAIISSFGGIVSAIISAAIKARGTDNATSSKKNIIPILIALIVFVIMFVFFLITPGKRFISKLTSPYIPFEIASEFGFENSIDTTDMRPFIPVPILNPPKLEVTKEMRYSGNHSLRVIMSIDALSPDQTNEYGGIGITESKFPDLLTKNIIAGIAWVYLPKSEQVINGKIFAHFSGSIINANGEDLAVFGNDFELIPGEWIPVFWGAGYQVFSLPSISFGSSDKKIHEPYLTIWSTEPYTGSIYVDDFSLFEIRK